MTKTNPYQEPVIADDPAALPSRGFTWAEWSIIVAVLSILCAGLYVWYVKGELASLRQEISAAQDELGTKQNQIAEAEKTLAQQIGDLTGERDTAQRNYHIWLQYANELEKHVNRYEDYCWSPLDGRPRRPN